jgi:hypothetical protein|tara:strand:- start:459 stop:956 length:498 start_codon:yes stop_codon:yes gene_type:complete
MSKEVITLIAKKHNTWVDIVTTFGCPKRIAEDITQEMYIKIHFQLEKEGNNIMYNDDVNYYYIFKTLKTLYLDLKRKHKNISIIHLEDHINDNGETHYSATDVNYEAAYSIIEKELSTMYWYDRKVFEIINGGESIAEFSRKSKIKYYSLYWTYNRVQEKLKKLL